MTVTKNQHFKTAHIPSARYCFVENLLSKGLMADSEYAVISEWFNYLITCPQMNFKIDQVITNMFYCLSQSFDYCYFY